jgi:hypothetical protein
MARSITLTFDGRNELLLKAIEAFEQADLFEDDEGNSVRLTREEIALNMLMEGCLEWVQEVAGLPQELEDEIREQFELEDEYECDEHCEHDHDHGGSDERPHLNN